MNKINKYCSQCDYSIVVEDNTRENVIKFKIKCERADVNCLLNANECKHYLDKDYL